MAKLEKTIVIKTDTSKATKDIKKLDTGVKNTGKSAKKSSGGIMSMTAATKALGLAFKAAGIGLVIGALVKMKDLMFGNMRMARAWELAQADMNARMSVFVDRATDLFIKITGAVNDPMNAVKKLGDRFKEKLNNRIEAATQLTGAFKKVFMDMINMDMDSLIDSQQEVLNLMTQINTGMTPEDIQKRRDDSKERQAEADREAKAAVEMTRQLQEVRDEEMELLLIRAEANKIIAKSRLMAEDNTLSNKKRAEALKIAIDEEKRVADIEIATQLKKVQALELFIEQAESTEEEERQLREEKAKLIELETASLLRQKRVATELKRFETAAAKEETDREKERLAVIDQRKIAKELELEFTEEMTSKEIKALIKKFHAEKKIQDKKDADDKKKREEELEVLRKANLDKEALELDAAKQQYDKLMALADKHGEDTTILTEKYNQQIRDIEKKFDDEELAAKKAQADKEDALEQQKFDNKMQLIDQTKEILNSMAAITQENFNKEQIALDKKLEKGLITEEEYAKATDKLQIEALKKEKQNAKFQILINTAQGIAAAVKAGAGIPFPANLGAILSGVAAVVAGVAQAKSVMNKVPGTTAGGEDTEVDAASIASMGGISGVIPNMNAISPEGDLIQPVQAYVVENDISDAQALQEELDIQATL